MDEVHDVDGVGGKARGLARLEACGCRVPRWAVVPSEVFRSCLRELGLDRQLAALLGGLDLPTAAVTSERIGALLAELRPTPVAVAAIEAAYGAVGGGTVAVRSSAVEEDGAETSFAGVHATYLNVHTGAEVVDRVVDAWRSAFSAPALAYRAVHGIEPGREAMAVVVQAMIAADRSGVLFTANPVSGSRHEMVLSAVYGVGEGLVSGAVDADTLVVDRDGGGVLSTHVGEKAEAHRATAGASGLAVETVDAAARDALALTPDEVTALCDLGRTIEADTGGPQDIEWAIDGAGAIWLLQTRPLTALVPPGAPPPRRTASPDEELRIWDNSNILESFGSVTAPLTFSFARYAYYQAYREYARLLGVPRPLRERMEEWLPNMLGMFDGRVYYNLLNWYKMIRLLPGYGVNRKILEMSMGLSEGLPDDLALEQVPVRVDTSWGRRLLHGYVFARFCIYFLTIERSVDRFLDDFSSRFDALEADHLDDEGSLALFRRFQDLERELLPKFGRMVLLEAVLAMSYGALQRLNDRWFQDAPEWFTWEVVRPKGPIASMAPVDRLAGLAAEATAEPAILTALDGSPDGARARLEQAGQAGFLRRVDAYIDDFGYRSANELKLEEPDLREDPTIFFRMLHEAVEAVEAAGAGDPVAASGHSADDIIRARLGGWRRVVYGAARRKVRRALQARESVRMCRSRAFGMTRRMMKAIGRDLRDLGALADERDIFYLELDELRAYMEGRGNAFELRDTVALRRRRYAEQSPVPGRGRFETHGVPYWGQPEVDVDDGAPAPAGGVLKGTPCVPGVAEGVVRVVSEPLGVNGDILATYRTDPGWITVLPTVSGLLIERGSPLTHVAIAAREFGIPTIVQVPALTQRLRSGDEVRLDGGAGTVQILVPADRPATAG